MDIERLEKAYQQERLHATPFAILANQIVLKALQNQGSEEMADNESGSRLTQTVCGIWVDEAEEKEPWLEF